MPHAPHSRRLARSFACAAALSIIFLTGPSQALDDQARRDAQAIIEKQLDAFARDDFASAYGLASPVIQEIFPNETVFMDMVRRGFQPLYRAQSHSFAETRDSGDGVEQVVRVIDAQGVEWDALYSLERTSDGGWRISGCRLIKSPERSA